MSEDYLPLVDPSFALGRSPTQQIVSIAHKYGSAGVNVNDHRFCRLVLAIAAMDETSQANLLSELRGGE